MSPLASPIVDVEMIDVDSHEMIPSSAWAGTFGEVGADMALLDKGILGLTTTENSIIRTQAVTDTAEITEESVWTMKGPEAPGAIDMRRRHDVLDAMGVERQLMFPTFGLIALQIITNPASRVALQIPDHLEPLDLGTRALTAYNSWAAGVSREKDSRIRAVGLITTHGTFDQLMADTAKVVEDGVAALWIPGSNPPAGTSPGNVKLDPFWDLLAKADVPVVFHLGTEWGLLASPMWSDGVPQFLPSMGSSLEFPVEPYMASTLGLTQINFLSALILGGVLERHPALRIGVIECAAQWVGPLAESLDLWFEEFHSRLSPHLSMRPSEYIARNVRVTPFVFEPVDRYIERYPHLVDVYCYSSDYPHLEGGRNSARKFADRLKDFDATTKEKFFRQNGSLLLP